MKMYKLLPALLFVTVFASCSNGMEEGASTTPTTTAPATNTTTTQPVQQTAPAGNTTQAGLNPPHGQPGHRCDISVGAPLNSPPGNSATTPQQQTIINPTPPPPAVMPAASGTQAGLNPAHGQPGHRCDIAVGAPLNSKPAQ